MVLCLVPAPKSETVCILKLDAIGDFIIFQTFLNNLSDIPLCQGKKMLLIGNEKWKELAELFHGRHFDSMFFFDPIKYASNPLYRIQCIVRIRRLGINVIINPTRAREYLIDDSVVRISGTSKVIGSHSNSHNSKRFFLRISDKWYDELVVKSDEEIFEFDWYKRFFESLGLKNSFVHPVLDSKKIYSVENVNDLVGQKYCVYGIGGNWPGKRWDNSRFLEMAQRIFNKYDYLPVLVGSSNDSVQSEKIISYNPGLSWVNLVGKLSLTQLIRVIADSELVLSNDTSIYHIGVAAGVKNICILGGGHFGQFGPYPVEEVTHSIAVYNEKECYNCNWYCPYHPDIMKSVPCIDSISCKQVMKEVEILLED